MRAGRLRHRLIVQKPTAGTADTYGAQADSWADFATVWGSVEPIGGREYFMSAMVQSDVTHRVTIRYLDGLVTDYRFKYGTRYLNIASIGNTEERNRELVCMCVEQV